MNNSFRLAPWSDALFAMDRCWWDRYGAEVRTSFAGDRYSAAMARDHGAAQLRSESGRTLNPGNSGAGALLLAHTLGAARAVLLGYDMQRTGGRAHWHADHPAGLGNAGSLPRWPQQFAEVAGRLRGMEVVNATRSTALRQWPTVALEEALACT